jgi:hypothetical protein
MQTRGDDYRGACERRYTKAEAIAMAALSGHCGPWHHLAFCVARPARHCVAF